MFLNNSRNTVLNTLLGLFLSYIYIIAVLPKKEQLEPNIKPTIVPIMYKGMIFIPFGKNALHIHHWMLCMLLCILLSMKYNTLRVLFGFFYGLFIHGLQYKDSFTFIFPNPYS